DEEVDDMEKKINQNCEEILALYNPVAIDLRLILAAIRISLNLERMGDHAEGVCHAVKETKAESTAQYLEAFKLAEMFDTASVMLDDIALAMKDRDVQLA